jgi:hypothetical protein
MAHGVTLDMIKVTENYRARRVRDRRHLIHRGNPEHYFAKPEPIRTHAVAPPELGDRRKYRATVRAERQNQS